MLVIRDVFHCKYGKGGPLVELFKEMGEMMPSDLSMRVMSDASGQFDTIVTEMILDDLAHWERVRAEEFANPAFADWFARMVELVESGSR